MTRAYTQADRKALLANPDGEEFRKTATIVAVQQDAPFTVETDRGVMTGEAGDWLVTNHPRTDVESDLWSISDERMRNTYERIVD